MHHKPKIPLSRISHTCTPRFRDTGSRTCNVYLITSMIILSSMHTPRSAIVFIFILTITTPITLTPPRGALFRRQRWPVQPVWGALVADKNHVFRIFPFLVLAVYI